MVAGLHGSAVMGLARIPILLSVCVSLGGSSAVAAGAAAAKNVASKSDRGHEGSTVAEKDDHPTNTCRKLPAGKRIVKLNLKPETSVADLVAWISAVTCMPFIVPGTIGADSKKVTIVSPELITPEEAYRLFIGALDSVGLTVYATGKFQRIIESPKAKTSAIPFCVVDDDSTDCRR